MKVFIAHILTFMVLPGKTGRCIVREGNQRESQANRCNSSSRNDSAGIAHRMYSHKLSSCGELCPGNSGDTYLISGSWGLAFACGGSDLLAPQLDSRAIHLPTAGRCGYGAVVPRSHRVGRKGMLSSHRFPRVGPDCAQEDLSPQAHCPPCAGPLVVPWLCHQTSTNRVPQDIADRR